MDRNSIFSRILVVVGLIIVASFAFRILATVLGFVISILIPVAIVVWLVRYISGNTNRNRYR